MNQLFLKLEICFSKFKYSFPQIHKSQSIVTFSVFDIAMHPTEGRICEITSGLFENNFHHNRFTWCEFN